MNPDVIKIAAVTAGTLIASPVMLASFRAFFFFGQMSTSMQRVEKKVDDFIGTTEKMLQDHDREIAGIKGERIAEQRAGGRRGSDPPLADTPRRSR